MKMNVIVNQSLKQDIHKCHSLDELILIHKEFSNLINAKADSLKDKYCIKIEIEQSINEHINNKLITSTIWNYYTLYDQRDIDIYVQDVSKIEEQNKRNEQQLQEQIYQYQLYHEYLEFCGAIDKRQYRKIFLCSLCHQKIGIDLDLTKCVECNRIKQFIFEEIFYADLTKGNKRDKRDTLFFEHGNCDL